MRIYFLNQDNLQVLEALFKDLYINTINIFKKNLELYKDKLTKEEEDQNFAKFMIEDIEVILEQMKKVEEMYIKWGLEILEKVRYVTVSKHTDKCIVRAVFDILFKYCFDFEYKISHLCCNNSRFKILQFEILRDLRWKIRD